MKNLKILLLFSCVSVFLFTSCSDESVTPANYSVASTSRLSGDNLRLAIAKFEAITQTSEYVRFKAASKSFALTLNGADDAPISSRTGFVRWIGINLARTNFTSTNDAIDAFDIMHSLGDVYVRANTTFWESLRGADRDDLAQIFAPIENPYIPEIEATGVCQSACMDACDFHIQYAESQMNNAFYAAAYSGDYGAFDDIQSAYDTAFYGAVAHLNTCMASCPA